MKAGALNAAARSESERRAEGESDDSSAELSIQPLRLRIKTVFSMHTLGRLTGFSLLRLIALAVFVSSATCISAADTAPARATEMSVLDNGKIRLGVDLRVGGAITWLSRSGGENVVNSHDFGRQIQLSFFSGPVPFAVGENQPALHWRHIGWNPIQAGDDFGNTSRVIEHRNDGRSIHVKLVPLQWPLRRVEGECVCESWLELDGNAVRAHARLTNARADKTQYAARDQELPAAYFNAPFHRPVSYTGDRPFTGEKIRELPTKGKIGRAHV